MFFPHSVSHMLPYQTMGATAATSGNLLAFLCDQRKLGNNSRGKDPATNTRRDGGLW